jgi:DNA polymerase I
MRYTYIDNITELEVARSDLLDSGVVGIDCESTGFDPYTDVMTLLQMSVDPEHAYVFNMRELNDPEDFIFFANILAHPRKVKIMQNGKFDLQFITRFFDRGPLPIESLYDTMIASKLIARGDNRLAHNLAAIAKRELDMELDKTLQTSDFGRLTHSDEQLMYAAKDAAVLLPIREAQKLHLKQYQLEKVARLEFDAVAAIADCELNGIYLDGDEWHERIVGQKEQHLLLRNETVDLLRPGVVQLDLFGEAMLNIDSPKQLGPVLQNLGVPIGASTKEKELIGHRHDFPVVDAVLRYREVATALKKFGDDYLRFIHKTTGRVHADFHQLTAPSGRMSCSKPNLQQVPREILYRQCFKAQTGGKIITADYGQIELRIMAMQSGDPMLVRAFVEGRDLHDQTAVLVLGCDPNNIPPEKRGISKNLNFGTAYGVGPPRFSEVAGIPEREAEIALRNYWKVYTVLDHYLTAQGLLAANQGYAKTHSGRTVRLRFDSNDRKAWSAAKRLGRNFGVQGTGADILKRALYLVRKASIESGYDVRVVNIVHDEIVVETNDDAALVSVLVERAMMVAGQEVLGDKIPCVVGVKIKETWTK